MVISKPDAYFKPLFEMYFVSSNFSYLIFRIPIDSDFSMMVLHYAYVLTSCPNSALTSLSKVSLSGDKLNNQAI